MIDVERGAAGDITQDAELLRRQSVLRLPGISGRLACGGANMILIEFPDRETEIKGVAVLMGGFSGKVLRGRPHIVPEPALEALNAQNIPYAAPERATRNL